MILALGFWSMVLGYTLVYTGVSWFLAKDKSKVSTLAQNLGLSSLAPTPQSNTGTVGTASSAPGTQYA